MKSKTTQELKVIQSALQEELAIKSEINCDEPGKTGDRCNTFKRPMSCSICGKAFTFKSQMDCHERIHTVKHSYPHARINALVILSYGIWSALFDTDAVSHCTYKPVIALSFSYAKGVCLLVHYITYLKYTEGHRQCLKPTVWLTRFLSKRGQLRSWLHGLPRAWNKTLKPSEDYKAQRSPKTTEASLTNWSQSYKRTPPKSSS